MSDRNAKNISYYNFFNSEGNEHKEVRSLLLEIPEFQREYVWGKTQIEELLKSIMENDKGYYVGNIVTVKSSTFKDKIVDGQQRLVTLSLIVKFLVRYLNKSNRKLANKIIFNDDELRITLQKKKITNIYKKIIKGEKLTHLEEKSSVYKASQNISNFFKKELKKEDKDLFFEKIKTLEFVVLKCGDEESAYQLFEGLNSTGLSLSAMELTKNAVLGKMKVIGSKRDLDKAVQKWDEMEKIFPSDSKSWPNKFLRHQWFSFDGYVLNPKLYGEIKSKKIKEATKKTLWFYINELNEDAKRYVALRKASLVKNNFNSNMPSNAWRKIQLFLEHMSSLGLDQIYAVLLSLNKYGKINSEYLKKEKFAEHVERLWSFAFIMKYSSVSPSRYERDFATLCKDIHDVSKISSYAKFKKRMESFFKDLHKHADVKKDFIRTIKDAFLSKTDRDMLRTLCMQYLSDGQETFSEYILEHIIPRGNLTEWKNVKEAFIEEVEEAKHKLGNLTLLKEDKVGNKNFNDKFKYAYRESKFSKNKKLKKEFGSLFNARNPSKAVAKRGKEMAEVIFNIYINKIYSKIDCESN